MIDALVMLLILLGTGLMLIASIGIVRLRGFYRRVHVPIKAATLGLFPLLISQMLVTPDEPTIAKILLILLFTATTTAITSHIALLAARRSGVPPEDEAPERSEREG